MSNPKLRRVLASAALVSALSLLPIRNAGAEPRACWGGEWREAAGRIAARPASFWDLLIRFLEKASGRIDPNDVNKLGPRIDPDGNS